MSKSSKLKWNYEPQASCKFWTFDVISMVDNLTDHEKLSIVSFSITPTSISDHVSWEIIFIYLCLFFFNKEVHWWRPPSQKQCPRRRKKIPSFALQNTPALQFTIGDKIVETLSSNGITSENKTVRTPPPSRPFKVGVFLVFNRWLEQRHNVAWRG